MTTEYVLILALYAFILLGAFIPGPIQTFQTSGPRLTGQIEKEISVGGAPLPQGQTFWNALQVQWQDPSQGGP